MCTEGRKWRVRDMNSCYTQQDTGLDLSKRLRMLLTLSDLHSPLEHITLPIADIAP